MIKLDVEKYCQDCPDFEAKVYKEFFEDFYGFKLPNTYISCKNTDKCRRIKRYLEKEIKNEKN